MLRFEDGANELHESRRARAQHHLHARRAPGKVGRHVVKQGEDLHAGEENRQEVAVKPQAGVKRAEYASEVGAREGKPLLRRPVNVCVA